MKIFFWTTLVDKPSRFRFFAVPLILVVALLFLLYRPAKVVSQLDGQTMGTYWQVSIAQALDDDILAALNTAITERLQAINLAMSTYLPESEISQFNDSTSTEILPISADFHQVVASALRISAQTDGHYDISVAPLVNLWGFGPDKIDVKPSQAQISAALETVGYKKLVLHDEGLQKLNPLTKIDLSSIAKGFAVDSLALMLEAEGYGNYLIDIGGEVVAAGDKYGKPWRIGVEQPKNGRQVEMVIPLSGAHTAIASSGNYRNFIDYDGERAVHTIDPRTGYPIASSLLSATVVGADCMNADAYATALMTLGAQALPFAEQQHLAVVLIYADDEQGFKTVRSSVFKDVFGEK